MTFFETEAQGRALLALCFAGAAAAVIYDLAGVVRVKGGKLAVFLSDLFCWMTAAALCFLAVAATGEKSARAYVPLGAACGVCLYRLGLRRIVILLIKRFQILKGKFR